jgi:hypothetical protein
MSAAQVSALRYQIHTFECLLKGLPIPDILLQSIESFSVIDALGVSTEELGEEVPSLQVNSKLNLNNGLIMCVPLLSYFDHSHLIRCPSDAVLSFRGSRIPNAYKEVVDRT